jgi:hypothetical protein
MKGLLIGLETAGKVSEMGFQDFQLLCYQKKKRMETH